MVVKVYESRRILDVEPGKLLPVVIAIHGGSFYAGSGNNYGPDFLLNEEDVVLVRFGSNSAKNVQKHRKYVCHR